MVYKNANIIRIAKDPTLKTLEVLNKPFSKGMALGSSFPLSSLKLTKAIIPIVANRVIDIWCIKGKSGKNP